MSDSNVDNSSNGIIDDGRENENDDSNDNLSSVLRSSLETFTSNNDSQSLTNASTSTKETIETDNDDNEISQRYRIEAIEVKPTYFDLIESTKTQMSAKFDQLEKESGLDLRKIPVLNSYKLANNDCDVQGRNGGDNVLLKNENEHLKVEINLKNEIINKMFKIRSQVESELEDLTASLFEEANKMVYKANIAKERIEKDLIEANLKIDMLTAEVQALKMLVITSTPSKPHNNHYPQLNSPKKKVTRTFSQSIPSKSPSNYELGSNVANHKDNECNDHSTDATIDFTTKNEIGELDPVFYHEFIEWRKSPTLEPMKSNFMKRIYDEEVYPVFNFKNKDLTSAVLRAIENNTLTVELVNGERLPFPKKCALLGIQRLCHYRMRMDEGKWYSISHLCRNRIANVCDLFCYLRYIQNGLVKSSDKEIYWQIMIKRRKIATSKLGFLNSSS